MRLLWAALLLSFAVMVGAAACGGGQTRAHPLDQSWSDEEGVELDAFRQSWKRPDLPTSPEVAIGIVDDQTILGIDLKTDQRWQYNYAFESRPVLTGEVLVGVGTGYLFALDPKTGDRRWWRKAHGWIRGVGDDGKTTVVTMEGISGKRSVVLAIDRGGHVLRQFFEVAKLGSPAVFDQFVFMPYERRQVVIFDLVAGTETARVVSSTPVSRAFLASDGLYFGHEDAFAFDDDIVEARRGGGTRVAPPPRAFPGSPRWLTPGDEPLPMNAVRHDSVRYLYAPSRKEAALVYHRLVVGLDGAGRTRWVHTSEAHHVGGTSGPGVVAVCDAAGGLRWLDARRGNVLGRADLGRSLRACLVQSQRPPTVESEPTVPLEDQLFRALRFSDQLHLPVQLELVDDLARIRGNRATAVMIALARMPARSAAHSTLQGAIRERIAQRRTGSSALRDALNELNRRWRPTDLPVAEIATALRSAGVVASANALGVALHHPYIDDEQRLAVAQALSALATRAQILALSAFATRYACVDEPAARRHAVEVVVTTLRRLGAASAAERARQGCTSQNNKSSVPSSPAPPPDGPASSEDPTSIGD